MMLSTKWFHGFNALITGNSNQHRQHSHLMRLLSWPVGVCPGWGCSPQPGHCGGISLWPPRCHLTGHPQCWQPAWPTSPCPLDRGCPVAAGRHNVSGRGLLDVLGASYWFTLLEFHALLAILTQCWRFFFSFFYNLPLLTWNGCR